MSTPTIWVEAAIDGPSGKCRRPGMPRATVKRVEVAGGRAATVAEGPARS